MLCLATKYFITSAGSQWRQEMNGPADSSTSLLSDALIYAAANPNLRPPSNTREYCPIMNGNTFLSCTSGEYNWLIPLRYVFAAYFQLPLTHKTLPVGFRNCISTSRHTFTSCSQIISQVVTTDSVGIFITARRVGSIHQTSNLRSYHELGCDMLLMC